MKNVQKFSKRNDVRVAFKFQFRQLNTFIHPEHQVVTNSKHLKRFKDTELSIADYKTLYQAVKNAGMMTICTPFDEESVELIEEMKFDIVKVASCSSKDWPLFMKKML